jgi:EAL domain-containing protein (putative c-di-GMP-specific phosphodiesterase class I)
MSSTQDNLRLPSDFGSGKPRPNRGSPQAPATSSMWFLCGRVGEGEPIRYVPIHSSPFVIGRRAVCELQLNCSTVSSVHAEFIDKGPTAALRDLGSTNGTFVNGKRLTSEVELASGDLIQFATQPFRVLKQDSSANSVTACENVCDYAMALVLFDRLITEQAVIPYYQPIVNLQTLAVEGVEVLARSRLTGLETPFQMFAAAAQLDQEVRLSQTIRWKAVQETMGLEAIPHLFLNTQPIEIRQPGLMESLRELRAAAPSQPITLEIHEAAVSDTAQMKRLGEELKSINVRLAFDDFGAGQARIAELTAVRPDYLKFDISLIRNIHLASPDHQQMVAQLVKMVRNLGILALAEGVESEAEAATCVALGFDLAQGFYFGRPAPMKTPAAETGR